MASSIVYRKSCTDILDRVYQREATSSCLGTVKFLAHFLTGGRPAVRYGYSCSSDTSR